jgi:hypothetical protein
MKMIYSKKKCLNFFHAIIFCVFVFYGYRVQYKSSNSLLSSIDNPLNIARTNNVVLPHFQPRVRPYQRSAQVDNIFGLFQNHEFQSKSESNFQMDRTRRAKLGEPILDDHMIASKEQLKRDLDDQIASKQRQKLRLDFEKQHEDKLYIGGLNVGDTSNQFNYRHRNINQLITSNENLLAHPEQNLKFPSIRWQPKIKEPEDHTENIIQILERQKREKARRLKQSMATENFFERFGTVNNSTTKNTYHTSQTDVTRNKHNAEARPDPMKFDDYSNDLRKQVEEREHRNKVERFNSTQADALHAQSFQNYVSKNR